MSKRAAIATSTVVGKKTKVVDPMEAKLATLKKAFPGVLDMPLEQRQVLEAVLSFALGQTKDKRDASQESAIELLDELLKSREGKLEKDVEDADAKLPPLEEAKQECADSVQEAQAAVDDALKVVQARKVALAAAARTFQLCKTQKDNAILGTYEAKASTEEHKELHDEAASFLTRMATLHDNVKDIPAFVKSVDRHGLIDSSLKSAAPVVFAKSPTERGAFDAVVVKQLEEWITKRVGEYAAKVAGADAQVSAADQTLKTAEAAFVGAKEPQNEAAGGYTTAAAAADAKDSELKVVKKALREAQTLLREATRAKDAASVELDFFKSEFVENFKILVDRSS